MLHICVSQLMFFLLENEKSDKSCLQCHETVIKVDILNGHSVAWLEDVAPGARKWLFMISLEGKG